MKKSQGVSQMYINKLEEYTLSLDLHSVNVWIKQISLILKINKPDFVVETTAGAAIDLFFVRKGMKN